MSRKISLTSKRSDTGKRETRDIAKYFVPAATISAFILSELRRFRFELVRVTVRTGQLLDAGRQ